MSQCECKITDVTGKVVRTDRLVSGNVSINMTRLSQGTYLVKYTDDDNSEVVKVNKL